MTALVSFDRVFEVLDLKPLIAERPGAAAAGAGRRVRRVPQVAGSRGAAARPDIEFDHVSFRYPAASEVSLASLESIALPVAERAGPGQQALTDVSFRAPGGQADGAGRAVRRRQDHHHAPGVADVRPDQRRGPDRRRRHQGRHAGVAARRGRRRHPGRAPVPRHHPGQPAVRPAGRHRARARSWRARRRRSGIWSRRCPTAWTPSSATAATGCRAARSSGSRWPGCC